MLRPPAPQARLGHAAAAAAVVLTAVLGLAVPVGAHQPPDPRLGAPGGCATFDPLPAAGSPAPGGGTVAYSSRATVHVYDARTSCRWDLRPDLRITTASVAKIEIMAGVLLEAQAEGRPLTSRERSLIEPMITRSENPPASALWSQIGGQAGMARLDDVFGLDDTVAGTVFGLTLTSARDQVELLRQVVLGHHGPVSPAMRREAAGFMSRVVPEQRWGVPSGVPAGWPTALKNGFFDSQCCRWRLNSAGVVFDPLGGEYAAAILADRWPGAAPGIEHAARVGSYIAAALAPVRTRPVFDTGGDPFAYGRPGDLPAFGDWGGQGTVGHGVLRGREWYLQQGLRSWSFTFGRPGDLPLVGDWDGDGIDEVGVWRRGAWHLRLDDAGAVRSTTFGRPTDRPVVGDWDGDGRDDLGVWRAGEWFLAAGATDAAAVAAFRFGGVGEPGVAAADLDGDGRDTPVVLRRGAALTRATATPGPAEQTVHDADLDPARDAVAFGRTLRVDGDQLLRARIRPG